ncbi:hypothetical protein N7462_004167 [Penicillium macrosclerotiorum]|uniref:uncharacterized protein n=1 Tax=Penicillium macrosclerotiorum TaxID=303699 RepID=UPI002547E5E4|nr:uncharacterized protein N7462_004167 [Penicillium macrosclerotiorum]KAJ5689775.1 hypothetical protein N7462_004167 [Penicillium macrosclerotiorum]
MSRTRQPAAGNSQVQSTIEPPQESSSFRLSGTLRLRGDDNTAAANDSSSSRHIRWSEDVVDNEGMGKKSSKVCCIYHKARPVGESSSESESSDSSSSDSDSDSDGGHSRHLANRSHHSHHRGRRSPDGHQSGESADADSTACCSDHHTTKHKRRKPSPNAYEKMPKYSKNHSQGS